MCTGSPAVAGYASLRAGGLSRHGIEKAVRSGTLTRVRRGVYAWAGVCDRVSIAASHGGVLACVALAEHLGLWVLEKSIEPHVWLRGDGHRYRHAGCRCVEHWDDGPTTTDAFGTPSVPRMLRQILACCGVEQFFVVLESARRKRLIDARGLSWLRGHVNAAGREAILLARADADSGLESLLRWRLRRHRLSVRTQRVIQAVGRVDLLIGSRLIVEADGRENHEELKLRHKDLVRDANAAAQGYLTLRFDYALIVYSWDLVERAILAQIDLGRHVL